MRAELIKAPPLDYDPYEEDCCGMHSGDRMVIHCDYKEKLKINILEKPSGIGPEYDITVEAADGRKATGVVHASLDDDNELNFYMKVEA